MKKDKDINMRADEGFGKIIKRIAGERVARGKDKKMKSSSRITKAMSRHPYMPIIESDIKRADLK